MATDNPFLTDTYPDAQQPVQIPADPNPFALGGAAEPTPPQKEVQTVYKGSILPLTKDSEGHLHFDPWNAGPGAGIRQAMSLPGRVASGEIKPDPANPAFIGEALNMAGLINPINPMVRSGDLAIPGVVKRAPDYTIAKTPPASALLDAGGRQLNEFRGMPIKYNPQAMPVLSTQIEQDLINAGVFPEHSPGLYQSIKRAKDIQPPPDATLSVGPGNLMALRDSITNHFGVAGEHQKGVGLALKRIDAFIENPPPGAVLAGPAAEGGRTFFAGNANYGAGKRGEGLDDIKRTADFSQAASNSGLNDNSLRSRVKSLVLDAKKMRGFTPNEETALENVPLGTPGRNALRYTANLFGGGGGLGAGLAMGAGAKAASYLGLPPEFGAVVPAIGGMLKNASAKSTAEALDAANVLTRQRSPLFQHRVKGQDLIPVADPGRDAIAKALSRTLSQPQGVPIQKEPPLEYDPNRV